jgi:hypothetical protein
MTQKEFINELDEKGYSYEIQGDKLVVTHEGDVYLNDLTSLPPGVEFKNGGTVMLNALTSIPPGVEFRNEGNVHLRDLTSLPPGVEFRNGGVVNLRALTSLPPGVVFRNKGDIYLNRLIPIFGGNFKDWKGNIKGINPKRLLNLMIKKGIFER